MVADLSDGGDVVSELERRWHPGDVRCGGRLDVAQTEAMAAAAVEATAASTAWSTTPPSTWPATAAPMEDLPPDEWDLCFAVNVKGTWLCSRAVAPR